MMRSHNLKWVAWTDVDKVVNTVTPPLALSGRRWHTRLGLQCQPQPPRWKIWNTKLPASYAQSLAGPSSCTHDPSLISHRLSLISAAMRVARSNPPFPPLRQNPSHSIAGRFTSGSIPLGGSSVSTVMWGRARSGQTARRFMLWRLLGQDQAKTQTIISDICLAHSHS